MLHLDISALKCAWICPCGLPEKSWLKLMGFLKEKTDLEGYGQDMKDIKFIADIMVGRLARYLRMAGMDVSYNNHYDDARIIETAKAESRIVLTRDALMLERRDCKNNTVKYLFIKSSKLCEQLKQVKNELGLKLEPNLIRCIECNAYLENVAKSTLEDKVPPYVYRTQKFFMYCTVCKKYYWRGTHYSNIQKYFDKIRKEQNL